MFVITNRLRARPQWISAREGEKKLVSKPFATHQHGQEIVRFSLPDSGIHVSTFNRNFGISLHYIDTRTLFFSTNENG